MLKRPRNLANMVITTLLSAGLTGTILQASAAPQKTEKCYGIVKKAKNDCGTKKHACAAQSTQSGARGEWLYVMKGNCKKIVGGHLKPSDLKESDQ